MTSKADFPTQPPSINYEKMRVGYQQRAIKYAQEQIVILKIRLSLISRWNFFERSYLHDTRGNENNFCGYCGQRLDWRNVK